jgi:hypothetical protein
MLTWVFAAKSSSTPFPIPQRRAAIVQFLEIYFSAPRGRACCAAISSMRLPLRLGHGRSPRRPNLI